MGDANSGREFLQRKHVNERIVMYRMRSSCISCRGGAWGILLKNTENKLGFVEKGVRGTWSPEAASGVDKIFLERRFARVFQERLESHFGIKTRGAKSGMRCVFVSRQTQLINAI